MKFEKVLRTYIAYKRDNQLYDFTDLPLYLYDMLNKFDEEIETIEHQRHEAIYDNHEDNSAQVEEKMPQSVQNNNFTENVVFCLFFMA